LKEQKLSSSELIEVFWAAVTMALVFFLAVLA